MRLIRQKGGFLVGVFLTVVVVALGVLGAFAIFGKNDVFAFVRQTTTQPVEPFTELSFADHEHLPKQLDTGVSYQVPITLTNHEHRFVQYAYQVQLTESGQTRSLDSVQVTLADGESATRTITLSADKAGPLVVTVHLLGKTQAIHFSAVAS